MARKKMYNGSSERPRVTARDVLGWDQLKTNDLDSVCDTKSPAKPDDTYHTKNSDILTIFLSLLTTELETKKWGINIGLCLAEERLFLDLPSGKFCSLLLNDLLTST